MSLYLDPEHRRALNTLLAMLAGGEIDLDANPILISADWVIETANRVMMTNTEREKLAGLTSTEGFDFSLDTLAPPSDTVALNATTSAHGLLPKLSGIATDFFNGTGAWSTPGLDQLGAATDILTLNASISAHGLLPKLSGLGTDFLSGEGEWVTPRLDLLATPADNTNLDATISTHGLLPKLVGDTTKYLRSDGTWEIPPGAGSAPKLDDCLAPDDNTDLNATASAHGLLPKLSGVSTEYLSGTGVFSTPAGGGGSGGAAIGVNVKDAPYSAAVDGTTDDTADIAAAAADIIAAGKGQTLVIPGSVKISGTLDLRGVSVLCLGHVVTTASTDMIIVGGASTVAAPISVDFRGFVGTQTMSGAQATPIIRVIGKNIQARIGTCKYVQVYADGSAGATDSTAYCTFYLGHVKQLEVASINSGVGPNVGWINECLFVGGRVNSLKISSAGSTPYKHNNLVFYNVTIEPLGSEPFVIDFANCNSILVFGRFEVGSGLANTITLAASCAFIRFRRLYRSLVDKVYEPYNFPANWIGTSGTITDAALDTRWIYDGEEDREYIGLANTDAGSGLAAFTWLFNPIADVAVRPGDIIAWHFPAGGNFRAYAAFFDASGANITPTSGDVTTHLDVITSALAWSAAPSGWFANSLLSGADITTAISRIIIIKAGSTARWARLGIRTGSATSNPPAGARVVIYRRPEFAGITPETRLQLATSTAPGLVPTIPADATKFLRGDGAWAVPSAGATPKLDDLGAPDDNTDLNVSTAAHGLCPKLPGGTTTFLRGDGAYAIPSGGGGASAGTTKQFWTNTPTIAQTDDVLIPRGPVTTFPLPSLAAAAQQRIVVLNQATADVLVKASPTVGVVDGSLYADDTVNYVTRHQLNEVAVASASQLTVLAWLRAEDATGSRVALKGRSSGTDFFMLRMAGDNAGANIGNYLCFETRLAGVRTSDHRFAAPFGSLYCVLLSINLNQAAATIKCRINGTLVPFDTVSPGPAWVQSTAIGGTQAGSIYSVASGEAGQTRRSWRGLVAGAAVWRTYIDLADDSLATLGYDDGPVALGQSGFSINGVPPIFVFNNHGASFSNGGSLGGSWVDASGQSSPVAGTGADVGILERIWGFSTGVAQSPGEARTYVRNPSGGTWAAI